MATYNGVPPSGSSSAASSRVRGTRQRSEKLRKFNRIVVKIAEQLTNEDKEKICFLYQNELGGERSNMTALAMLEKLHKTGVFLHTKIEPLMKLLGDCCRHDLVEMLELRYHKKDANSVAATAKTSFLVADTRSVGGPSKRARFKDMEDFGVSDVYKECSNAAVHGVIVRVSRLHTVKGSSKTYFTAEITDGKTTMKLVCDDLRFKRKMEVFKEGKFAITIKNCSISQSIYPTTRGNFELQSNPTMKMYESRQKEFNIQSDGVYTHSTILHQLVDLKNAVKKQIVTVCGKIVRIGEPSKVTRKETSETFIMRECVLADHGICVKLKIWQEEVGMVCEGSSYRFINVKVKEYDGERYLSTNESSEINKIDDIIGEMSSEMLPSDHIAIQGEISAVKSVFKYKQCTSQTCLGRVKPVADKKGECTKCGRIVKLSLCTHSVCAKFTIQDQQSESHDVTAFNKVIDDIIGHSEFSCSEVSESELMEQLFDASRATFVVNRSNDIVAKVTMP